MFKRNITELLLNNLNNLFVTQKPFINNIKGINFENIRNK